jgi:DNA sulfur modification protein DndD
MILTKLIVENFGLFKGRHEFELEPRDKSKPITLIFGKNGSGKTTLFEAIKLCLYGNRIYGRYLPTNKYKEYLGSKIHRSNELVFQPYYASITIEFKYSHVGIIYRYKIIRYWENIKGDISEYVKIYKNDELLDIDEERWFEFINTLIPQGLADLFFFDGEKIQKLANDNGDGSINNLALKESFNSLFGIDILEKAIIDLTILNDRIRRNNNGEMSNTLEEELEKLKIEKEEIERKISLFYDERAQLQNNINYLEGQIEKIEQHIILDNKEYGIKRNELKIKSNILTNEINKLEDDIRRLAEGLLPFAVVPEYCMKVHDHIITYMHKYKETIITQNVINKLLELYTKLPLMININKEEIKILEKYSKLVIDLLSKELTDNNTYNINVLSKYRLFSEYEMQKMLRWLEDINTLKQQLTSIINKLNTLIEEKKKVEKMLFSYPDEIQIDTLLQQLNKLNTELADYKTKLMDIDNNIRILQNKSKDIEKRIKDIIKEKEIIKKYTTKEVLLNKIIEAFQEFILQVREKRLRQLEDNVSSTLSILLQEKKRNTFNRIRIDNDFSITLYNDTNVMKKDVLSAGEKQIYAIALLWSLIKCSNKPMPIIIDTPLARLDSEHRYNLIHRFFPNISHQIIIFSTDTEIDREYFNKLQQYISHTYHLVYDNGITTVERSLPFHDVNGVEHIHE